MKLSLIIPYHDTLDYTVGLLRILKPQMTNDVECIIIDDDSTFRLAIDDYKWVRFYGTNNHKPSIARNIGIDCSFGDYIQFIDSDDTVAPYFVRKILEKIDNEQPDIIEFSWKSLVTDTYDFKLKENDRLAVPSVVTRTFKRSYIGDVRFNEFKDAAEDEDFSRKLGYIKNPDIKVSVITDYMYYYRDHREMSNVSLYQQGRKNTKRIIYYIPKVTSDMQYLVNEIRDEDRYNEVVLMTNQCDILELTRYCQVMEPCDMWCHIFRGSRLKED